MIEFADEGDDETTEVTLDDEAAEGKKPGGLINETNEYSPNLVEVLVTSKEGKKALKDLADEVLAEIEEAREAREELVEKNTAIWNATIGHIEKRKPPFEDSANLHVPILIENLARIVFHAYGELFGDWRNVWGVLPIGPEDDRNAQILTIHGNWQLRQQIPGFKRQMHRALLAYFAFGDVVSQGTYDATRRLNKFEVLAPDEWIVPYAYTSVEPDFADLPWYARVLKLYKHELERHRDDWYGVDEVLDKVTPSWSDEPEKPMADAVADLQGQGHEDAKRAPYTLYWYEGYIDLPGQDRQRFCKVIIDQTTRGILLLNILETDNWQDLQRYQLQTQEKEAYFQQQQAAEQAQAQREQQQGALSQRQQEAQMLGDAQQAAEVNQALQALSSAPLPPPPVPPSWMVNEQGMVDPAVEPEPIGKEEVRLFAHGVAIEPLVGNVGIGYGSILRNYQVAANAAASQFSDAASLANGQSFLVSDTVRMDKNVRVRPGAFIQVRGVANIRDGIMPLQMNPANPQLLEQVDRCRSYAQAAAQSPEVLGGEPGKSGETARGIAARIEQATKILSVLTRKFLDFFEQILKVNAFLNSVYLRDEEIFIITNHALRAPMPAVAPPALPPGPPGAAPQGPPGAPPQLGAQLPPGAIQQPGQPPGPPPNPNEVRVGRALYQRSYEVEFAADLRFSSQQQRIGEADEIVQMALSVPILAANALFQYAAVKKALEARGKHDMVALMGPAPPLGMPPPPPPGAKPPGPPPGGNVSAKPPPMGDKVGAAAESR